MEYREPPAVQRQRFQAACRERGVYASRFRLQAVGPKGAGIALRMVVTYGAFRGSYPLFNDDRGGIEQFFADLPAQRGDSG